MARASGTPEDVIADYAQAAAAQIVEHAIATTRDREMGRRVIDSIMGPRR